MGAFVELHRMVLIVNFLYIFTISSGNYLPAMIYYSQEEGLPSRHERSDIHEDYLHLQEDPLERFYQRVH